MGGDVDETTKQGNAVWWLLAGVVVAVAVAVGIVVSATSGGETTAPDPVGARATPTPSPPSETAAPAASPAGGSPAEAAPGEVVAARAPQVATAMPPVEARLAREGSLMPRVQLAQGVGATAEAAHDSAGATAGAGGDGEEGGLVYAPDATGIRAAMAEATPQIKDCYEAWIRERPELAGKLKLTFTIAQPEGEAEAGREDERIARVTRVSVADSTVDHALLEGCVMNVTSGLKFDPPEADELTVQYPFVFSTGDAPPAP